MRTPTVDTEVDEPPPFLQSWPRVYTAVVIYLALLITGLAIFSRLIAW